MELLYYSFIVWTYNSLVSLIDLRFGLFQILMVLYQMRVLLVEGTLSEKPPLLELPEAMRVQHSIKSTTVGTELNIGK